MKEILFCYENNAIVESIIWILQSHSIDVKKINPSKIFDLVPQHIVIIPISVMHQHTITRSQLDDLTKNDNNYGR